MDSFFFEQEMYMLREIYVYSCIEYVFDFEIWFY